MTAKAHAMRLGLDIAHIGRQQTSTPLVPTDQRPHPGNLPRAGSMLAASWFMLCGHDVSWPLEPCRYDLVAFIDMPAKIQVKTARVRSGSGWVVWLSSTGDERRVYDPDDIDYFSSSMATSTTTSSP